MTVDPEIKRRISNLTQLEYLSGYLAGLEAAIQGFIGVDLVEVENFREVIKQRFEVEINNHNSGKLISLPDNLSELNRSDKNDT